MKTCDKIDVTNEEGGVYTVHKIKVNLKARSSEFTSNVQKKVSNQRSRPRSIQK